MFGLLLGVLLIVWSAYFHNEHLVRENSEQRMRVLAQTNAMLLEEQLSRTLDSIATALKSAPALRAYAGSSFSTKELQDLVLNIAAIRSISLIDRAGRVLASSTEANVGVQLPSAALPAPGGPSAPSLSLGAVWPYRDLQSLAAGSAPDGSALWLAVAPPTGGGRNERWVVAINPEFFQNFWSRMGEGGALSIGVFDYRGRFVLGSQPGDADTSRIGAAIARALGSAERGLFDFDGDLSPVVAYRASGNHPVIVAIVVDREHLTAMRDNERRLALLFAVAASLAAALVLGLLYRGYIRYETASNAAENRARALEAHVMLCQMGPDGVILDINDAFLEVSGYAREELVGTRNILLAEGTQSPALRDELWREIGAGRTWRGTLRGTSKAGQQYWTRTTIVPFTDPWGRIEHLAAMSTDLTEVTRLDARLQEERRLREELIRVGNEQRSTEMRLREAQKLEAIGQLTGGLAHDFNNLLGIVLGNLDVLEETLPDPAPAVRRRIDTARNAALRGAEVTRALLAVARRQPLQIASHDLNALVKEALPLVRTSVGSSVEVRLQLAPGELLVRIDAAGLSNLLLNLSINARDAMLEVSGERTLTLRTRRESVVDAPGETLTPGEYALLEVIDIGAGMSERTRAQAFEPFFTTKDRGKGTGLGLSMAYGFAEQLGGTARIYSIESTGTTVQVYLPIEVGQAAVVRAHQAVLVVDEDPTQCEFIRLWLESLGYSVATAHSAEAALEQLATRRFDVLFSDEVIRGGMDVVALAQAKLPSRQSPSHTARTSSHASWWRKDECGPYHAPTLEPSAPDWRPRRHRRCRPGRHRRYGSRRTRGPCERDLLGEGRLFGRRVAWPDKAPSLLVRRARRRVHGRIAGGARRQVSSRRH